MEGFGTAYRFLVCSKEPLRVALFLKRGSSVVLISLKMPL